MSKDSEIIQRIEAGDESAVSSIYEDHRIYCIAWLTKRFGCDTNQAIEIFQWCVVIFYDNVVSGRLKELKSSIRTYLLAIAKNKIGEEHRHKNRFKYSSDTFLFDSPDDDNELQLKKEKEELYQKTERSLKSLGEPCKTLIELFYYYQLSLGEIRERLKYKSVDSVKTAKYKCMQRLKKML
ncbi:MAG: sigma-70 family RNA polymerase sigma factor [Bacteroidota bacterium]